MLDVSTTGTYSFQLDSDDGSYLFIDGNLVVSDGGQHNSQTVNGSVTLTAGLHSFDAKFFENGIGASGFNFNLPSGVAFGGLLGTANTDTNGNYSFTGIGPGTYSVQVVPQSGYAPTTPASETVTTTGGQDVSNLDFGEFLGVVIGGKVYLDANGDGLLDGGESGLAGWTVDLVNTANQATITATTSSTGDYSFGGVAPGAYTIELVQQSGYVASTATSTSVTTASGQNIANVDFGEFVPVTIGGEVFSDLNDDGVLGGNEPGLSDWAVNLINSSNKVVQTTESSTTGAYSFLGVAPGVYMIQVVQQSGYVASTATSMNATIVSGQNVANVDIGEFLPLAAAVTLDPASDSGAPDHPGFTNDTTPTFDVQVNQAGTIEMDFDGNGTIDATLSVADAGTYELTAPTLADGTYTAVATFVNGGGKSVYSSIGYIIDTDGAHVTSMSPTGTIGISASGVTVTFNEPVDLNTFTPSAITFTGPGGTIAVNQPQLVSGTTYSIALATQAASGAYSLTIAPSVTDFAGNKLDQNQNGINGEPTDAFTGSFTEALPVGGPIALNSPTLGFVPANHVDDWTFFGRAGQTITSVVATSAAGDLLPPPPLDYAQVTLEDSNGNVLGTASNTQSGAIAELASITLPADGTYHVHVQGTTADPGATGFYDLTVADATVHQFPLAVNTTETGQLEDQYSSDAWTFSTTANQQVQLTMVVAVNPDIEFDLTGPNGYTAFSGVTTDSGQINLPYTGTYTLTVHTTGQAGGYGFELEQASQIALTPNAPYQMPLVGTGQSQLFDVTLAASNPLEISLTDANPQDQNEVYVSYGEPPTRYSYDDRYTGGEAPNQTVVLTAKPGTYYILVYNNLAKSAGSYTIEADSAPFLLSGMSPGTIGNSSPTTLLFTGVFPLATSGGGYVLKTAPTVQLIAQDGTVVPATPLTLKPPTFGSVGGQTGGVNPDGTMTVSAVLPGGLVLPGTYSVRVTDDNGYSQTLNNALTVVQGGLGILKTNLIVPNPIGYHVASTIYVQYSNIGNAPLQAPLLVLDATQDGKEGALMTLDESLVVSGFWTSATPDGYSQSVEILASGAVPGILQPGESESIPVYYAGWLESQWDFSRPPINFNLGVLDTTNTQPTNWASLDDSLQPEGISQAAWNALYPNLESQLGPTLGDYVQRLDTDAQYLGGLGEDVSDVGQLFDFEVQQAEGYSPLSSLASSTDAQVDTPGLPLSFDRTFTPGIISRNQFGRFGWGWSDSWDTSLTVDPDGSVNVYGPDGSVRRFQPDSRGGYFDQAGDYGTLEALVGGGFTLTETDGQVTAYNPDGTLNYVQDTNGNRITASYTDGLLTM
ncbi:MAG: SdrD B-like domain-containing protein, partial [Isosphaeraceae bacterium]